MSTVQRTNPNVLNIHFLLNEKTYAKFSNIYFSTKMLEKFCMLLKKVAFKIRDFRLVPWY